MNRVYITDYISDPKEEIKVLGQELSSKLNHDIEVLMVWHERIDKEFLDKFPKIKGVVRYGVGYDNIDLEEIKKRDVVFCNTPDYGTDEVSDTSLAMMLSLLRGVFSYDILSRNYKDTWQENTNNNLRRLSSQTLGVIGAGRIGTALMLKTKALGMNIIFYDPYKDSGYEKSIGVRRTYKLNELLSQADVVSIHAPLTRETNALVDFSFIESMKQGSVLINTARGEIIKDLDLIYKALKSNKLYAVALDVLPDEPPFECKLINAWRNNDKNLSHRIIINPHTSYFTQESFIEMRVKASENAMRILKNLKPLNIIADGRKV